MTSLAARNTNTRFKSIQRIVGILLVLSSGSMLPPVLVSIIYQDLASLIAFLEGFAVVIVTGLVVWLPVRHVRRELRIRDGFLVVVACWLVMGLSGAVPLYLADEPALSLTDAGV